jgi:hypothetical protein
MFTRNTLSALFLCAVASSSLFAQSNPPSAEALERSLAGSWKGALEYRDYQSNRKFELPVTTTISVGADNATITRLSAFDDGPTTGLVYITTVSLYEPVAADGIKGATRPGAPSRMTQSTFRKGRAVDTWTENVTIQSYTDPERWSVAYTRTGTDGNSPADIRLTTTRNRNTLTTVKEVKKPGEPDSAYAFRNQTVLRHN